LNGLAKTLNQLTSYFKLDDSAEPTPGAVHRVAVSTAAKKRSVPASRAGAIREPESRVRRA